jgi:hypothetical protein
MTLQLGHFDQKVMGIYKGNKCEKVYSTGMQISYKWLFSDFSNHIVLCIYRRYRFIVANVTQFDQIKEDEMQRAYSTHLRDEKCIQSFGRKIWREETTWKT